MRANGLSMLVVGKDRFDSLPTFLCDRPTWLECASHATFRCCTVLRFVYVHIAKRALTLAAQSKKCKTP